MPRGGGATSSATSWLPASCSSKRPSLNALEAVGVEVRVELEPVGGERERGSRRFSASSSAASSSRVFFSRLARTVSGARRFIAAQAQRLVAAAARRRRALDQPVGIRTARMRQPLDRDRRSSRRASPPRRARADRRPTSAARSRVPARRRARRQPGQVRAQLRCVIGAVDRERQPPPPADHPVDRLADEAPLGERSSRAPRNARAEDRGRLLPVARPPGRRFRARVVGARCPSRAASIPRATRCGVFPAGKFG